MYPVDPSGLTGDVRCQWTYSSRLIASSFTSTPRPGRSRRLQAAVFGQVGVVQPLALARKEVFQDLEVGRGGGEVEVDGGGERAHGVVRGDGDVVCFCDGRDLSHLQQAAAGADVGLNDVGPVGGHQVQEFEPGVETLARGQRDLHLGPESRPGRDVLGTQRLFVE